ncbi:MAG: hypothetical protein HY840_15590 [Bacteroidetes bacterium]|nr:hypothetical protein [Bacteroidota bacterium]
MKIIVFLSILFLFSSASCKNKKSATITSSPTTQQQTTPANPTTPPPADDSYRLVVSFYSTAGGIDPKAHNEFIKFLNAYPKKIAYTPTPWGREGEVDYCLKLSELSTRDQADFVKKINELLSNSKLVHITENAKCVNKH